MSSTVDEVFDSVAAMIKYSSPWARPLADNTRGGTLLEGPPRCQQHVGDAFVPSSVGVKLRTAAEQQGRDDE
jgi:hypothetical protein